MSKENLNGGLSKKQVEAIELMIENSDLEYNAIAKMLGINPCTLWRWRTQPQFKAFQDELKFRLKNKFDAAEGAAIDTMIELCKTGSFQAAKYILDYQGYGAPNKIEVKGEISNPMAELTLEELRKLAAE